MGQLQIVPFDALEVIKHRVELTKLRRKMETSTTDPTLLMLIGGIVVLLAGSVAYGVYSTFGSGSKELRDTIDEHAKMHELGIAHGHGGNSEAYEMSGKLQKDNIS
tara:strand:- start:166 stop:483 length:318 start_codon:yes stop_codon:yes gene_type:complete